MFTPARAWYVQMWRCLARSGFELPRRSCGRSGGLYVVEDLTPSYQDPRRVPRPRVCRRHARSRSMILNARVGPIGVQSTRRVMRDRAWEGLGKLLGYRHAGLHEPSICSNIERSTACPCMVLSASLHARRLSCAFAHALADCSAAVFQQRLSRSASFGAKHGLRGACVLSSCPGPSCALTCTSHHLPIVASPGQIPNLHFTHTFRLLWAESHIARRFPWAFPASRPEKPHQLQAMFCPLSAGLGRFRSRSRSVAVVRVR